MANILEIFGTRRADGLVGVEIEVEGENLPQRVFRGWKAVPDGSLRNGGIEYVTLGAISLKELSTQMNHLADAFKKNQSKILDAHRGSVHVHVNVQDKTPEQVFTTLFLWLLVENLWMDRCGPTRNGNLFCMSSSGSGEIIPYSRQLLARSRDGAWFQLWNRGKYSALNTDCLATFGSLEFRTFPSTVDKTKIETWAKWCTNLVEQGCKINPDKLYTVWEAALNNPRKFFIDIFGENHLAFLTDADLFAYAEQGAEAASDMLFIWEEHKALVAKHGIKPMMAAPKIDDLVAAMFDDEDPEPDEDIDEDDEDIDEDDEL